MIAQTEASLTTDAGKMDDARKAQHARLLSKLRLKKQKLEQTQAAEQVIAEARAVNDFVAVAKIQQEYEQSLNALAMASRAAKAEKQMPCRRRLRRRREKKMRELQRKHEEELQEKDREHQEESASLQDKLDDNEELHRIIEEAKEDANATEDLEAEVESEMLAEEQQKMRQELVEKHAAELTGDTDAANSEDEEVQRMADHLIVSLSNAAFARRFCGQKCP